MREYHPGRGVYRSSYKNALRVARTEINYAYRSADYECWNSMDFVVGIEVKTSQTNHQEVDICDLLAGKYPKDFKFTGWHPNCRCFSIPILNTMEEFSSGAENSVNEVKDLPDNFKQWVKGNQDRIDNANSLPYFIKDNKKLIYPQKKSVVVLDGTTPNDALRRRENRKSYEQYKEDDNYRDVKLDDKSGGFAAIHINHNFDKQTGKYEKYCQETLFKQGNSCILTEERGNVINQNILMG